MKKYFFSSLIFLASLAFDAFAQQNNTLTAKEREEGWVLLFNGRNFDGLRAFNGTEMPEIWTIDNGAMRVAASARLGGRPAPPPRDPNAPRQQRPANEGPRPSNDIVFGDKKFSNFELSLEWMVAEGANSGIFYYVVEGAGMSIFSAAPEIQVLDNWNAPDNKGSNRLAGSLYDMIPALPSNAKPAGEWNRIVVRVKDGNVTHTQNGQVVVQYTLWTPEWKALVANSKFAEWPGFRDGPAKEGFIGLQDHNDNNVWFRNIKIREL